MIISQALIKEATEAIDPTGVNYRQKDKLRKRGYYIVKGPNHVWLVDSYDKLADYSFHIYGMLDGYSHFVLNAWTGITNQYVVAIMKFYLICIAIWGMPKQSNLIREQKLT